MEKHLHKSPIFSSENLAQHKHFKRNLKTKTSYAYKDFATHLYVILSS